MPHGYIQDGQPVEIIDTRAFTTPTIVVASDEAAQYGVTAGTTISHITNHPAGAVLLMGAPARARYGIQTFDELGDPPNGKVLSVRGLRIVSGVISAIGTYVDAPPEFVPSPVTAAQMQHAMLQAGILDDVETFVASATRSVQIYWAKSIEFHRDHPTLVEMIEAFGMTSNQADDIFRAADTFI